VTTCPKCGTAYGIGDFPFCKGGHKPYKPMVIDDTIEGGPRWFETLGHEEVWIESKSQLKREAEARGYEPCSRHDTAFLKKRLRMHEERVRDEQRV
jgi:hypothetical protein